MALLFVKFRAEFWDKMVAKTSARGCKGEPGDAPVIYKAGEIDKKSRDGIKPVKNSLKPGEEIKSTCPP